MKEQEIKYFSQISEAIVSDKYIEEILNLVAAMTAKLMGSKICSIMLLDKEKNELFITATQSLSPTYRNKPNIKVGQSVSGRAVNEKKPVTVMDVTSEANYMYPEIAKQEGIVSMLAVPMTLKGEIIGVVNSYTETEHEFSASEIDTLQAVANQAAVAIENTKLRNEVLKTKEDLENRKKVEKAKGLLMENLGINEKQAYEKIRKKSMDSRKTMPEIAEAIILAHELSS